MPGDRSWKRILWRTLAGVGATAGLLVGTAVILRWWTDRAYASDIYTVDAAPLQPVAIVFGAGVWPSGQLSDVLADRVSTAAQLYHAGKVRKLLMTGDNRFVYYNEPGAMHDFAVGLGVPSEDIVLDYAGRRTYDSCYRARHIFGVTRAILVTQAYHLDRALFTADALGIEVVGVPADQRDYRYVRQYWWREVPATAVAWWQTKVSRPLPVMGEPLPIALD